MPLIKLTPDDLTQGQLPLDEGEVVQHTQPNVALYFTPMQTSEGVGTLQVSTKRVIWLRTSSSPSTSTPSPSDQQEMDTGEVTGYSIDFHYIMCHAIARGNTFDEFPKGSIYCQLDSEDEIHEVSFVPENQDALNTLFQAFSDSALLNPDPVEEGEGEFFQSSRD